MTVLTLSQKVAPRISRSFIAILKPLPRSVNSRIAAKRFSAISPADFVPLIHQKCISRPVRAPDTSAQLIQLGQSYSVRIVDDDRVDVEMSSPVSMIVVATRMSISPLIKLNMIFSSSLRHLPVCKCHIRIRHHFPNLCRHICNRIDAVEHNTPDHSGQLTGDRLTHHFFIIFHHIGLDRLTFLRRFLQHALYRGYRPETYAGSVESACRQGQHIHVLFHFLDLFLMGHAKALLLVDHQKTKILILHI